MLASLRDNEKDQSALTQGDLCLDRASAASTLQTLIDGLNKLDEQTALVALTRKGRNEWTYRKLDEKAHRFAAGLVHAGFRSGEAIAIFAENSPEWIAAVLGVIRSGAVVMPLDVQLDDNDLDHVLTDSRAQAVITSRRHAARVERLISKQGSRLILLDGSPDDGQSWVRFGEQREVKSPTLTAKDPAVLFYTSGTTGPPKGVPLTHGNIGSQLEVVARLEIVRRGDRVLLPLPLHHVYPFVIGMLAPLFLGLRIVLPFSLTGPQLLRAFHEGDVTAVIGVPRLYSALYDSIISRVKSSNWFARQLFAAMLGLSVLAQSCLHLRMGRMIFHSLHQRLAKNLRLLASGGAAIGPDLVAKLEALGWQVAIGYGLTETSPLLSINLPIESRHGSVGKPFPGVELRIDPGTLEESGITNDHRAGEILARGPNVFAGYRNLSEQTERAFTSDGWFRTGDLGYFDKDNFLFVTGRSSTLIKTESGEKIQTEDLEAAYSVESRVREIGVLQKGGKLVALVVPRLSDPKVDVAGEVRAAIETASSRLPSYERISEYIITRDALPRTRLGKIQRHLLAQRFEQAQTEKQFTETGPMAIEEMSGEDRALLEHLAALACWEILIRRYPGKRLTLDRAPQFDLGIDSLEWLNLTLEIAESTGVELTDEAIARIETVRDLLREVTEADEGHGIDPLSQPEGILDPHQKRWLEPLGPVAQVTAQSLYALGRILMRLFFGLRSSGIENLPCDQPWVLVPNHVSYLDPFAIAALFDGNQLCRTYWAGWTGIVAANPIMRFLSRLGKILPVEPTRAARTGLALGAIILRSGKNLVWFPEGGRSVTGELQPFKPGIGMLLERFPVVAVPMFVEGTYQALPFGRRWPRFHPIRVIFGRPQTVNELLNRGRGQKPHEKITDALQQCVAELRSSSSHE